MSWLLDLLDLTLTNHFHNFKMISIANLSCVMAILKDDDISPRVIMARPKTLQDVDSLLEDLETSSVSGKGKSPTLKESPKGGPLNPPRMRP